MLKKLNWQRLKEILGNVYRFQVIDEDHFDVKFVFVLKPLNIIVAVGLLLFFFTMLNFFLIAYTPLKQYIPGYGSTTGRKNLISLNLKADQLESNIQSGDKYIKNLQNILNDKVVIDAVKKEIPKVSSDTGTLSIKMEDEAHFIQEMEKGLQNSALNASIQESKQSVLSTLSLFRPTKGKIISAFNPQKSTGIEMTAQKDEQVLSPVSGIVISEMPALGIIVIQSENQLVCIVKNLVQVSKKTGNFVQKGDAIGIAGFDKTKKTASCTLELWYKGQPLDAGKYLRE